MQSYGLRMACALTCGEEGLSDGVEGPRHVGLVEVRERDDEAAAQHLPGGAEHEPSTESGQRTYYRVWSLLCFDAHLRVWSEFGRVCD